MKKTDEGIYELNFNSKSRKRKKIYEAIKTILICVLCVTCMHMAYRIIDMHSNSGMGESAFRFMGSDPERMISSEMTAENILETFLEFSKPEQIIVKRGENRGELKEEDDNYGKTMDFVNKVMQSIHSTGAKFSKVSAESVRKNLMMANSVYIKYPYEKNPEMDARFFQMKNSNLAKNITAYSEVFLIPDTASNMVTVFLISNDNTEEMVKIQTESFAATLAEIINNLESIRTKDYAFASELNLDKSGASGTGITLASMMAIPLNTQTSYTVTCDIPWGYADALKFTESTDFSSDLMNIFNYNPNTIRQYAANDGTLTFVSGKGTLGMHPDGVLEYKALDRSEGIAFSSGTTEKGDDLYTSSTGVIKTVKKILNLYYSGLGGDNPDIRFTGITKHTEGDIRFCLDYFVNGYRVKMKTGCAIDARVQGGVLTELKMQIASFKRHDTGTENQLLINAIDNFYKQGTQNKKITGAGLVYKFSGMGNEMNTDWEIHSE